MNMRYLRRPGLVLLAALLSVALNAAPKAGNTLVWNKDKDRVDADVRTLGLATLLERIATETGWQVFAEPGTTHTASSKFKNLPSGEALRLLLGDLNFTLVPQTNSSPRLYVFRTEMKKATRQVRAFREAPGSKRIPNELIVKLRPGADINELARKLGAKVIGCIEKLKVCRLQFADAAAADAARELLALDDDVTAVDYNYSIDRPNPEFGLANGSAPQLNLQLNPPPDAGQIIIGMVDTDPQPLCGDLNKFLLKTIYVAGQAQPSANTPPHANGMANIMLLSLQAATKGSTSVQIQPVDVYGPNPSTSTYDVANGIVTAVNNGANIINLSLGGQGYSPFLESVIQAVRDRGIPIVAAAGNQPVTTPFYPAAYPGVLAVTAVESGQIAPYANRGSFVNVAAPDSGVFCFNGQSYYVQGTSASAAYTSGMAA
ncbi:MAG: S8 family serine peptidase, partial [Verrucomicrobiota bacterium]